MSNCYRIFASLLLLAIGFETYANDIDLCKSPLPTAAHLAAVAASANAAKSAMCSEPDISMSDANQSYMTFLDSIAGWFDPYGGFKNGLRPIDVIKSKMTPKNTSIAVGRFIRGEFDVKEVYFGPANVSRCPDEDCSSVINEFLTYYQTVQGIHQSRVHAACVANRLMKLEKSWDSFLEQMRSQTALELSINGWAYKRTSEKFEDPPSSQLIVLHPTLLVENVSAAVDGEETQEALGIEIVGINWWQQDKWYLPSGGSLLALHSDRKETDDMGWGIAVHFLSDYTLGYANHGGSDGFFVSIDLLKAVQNKKKAFESYKFPFD